VAAINVVLIDLSRDVWGYISLGYLRQRRWPASGLIDDAPQVNPIDFENAEGNLGIAKRTVQTLRGKAAGVTLAARPHGFDSAAQHRRGAGPYFDCLESPGARTGQGGRRSRADCRGIRGAWEVLGEAVQTVLRAAGSPSGYEKLKDFTADVR